MSDAAMATRLRMPLEYSAISLRALVQLEQLQQLARALRGHGPREAVHAADEFEKLPAGEAVEQQRFIGHQADALLDLEFLLGHGHAQQFDRAGGGGIRPVSMRMVVDLPAPLAGNRRSSRAAPGGSGRRRLLVP